MKKVVPSERLRRELDDVLNGITEEQDPIEAVARLGARLILQQALEDEVTDFVGRARHERANGGEEVIYRNGFAEPSTVRTTSGAAVIERPRVRDATKVGFESRVLGKGVARTHALEALVICSFLRGLSVRDVAAALEECFGEQVIAHSCPQRLVYGAVLLNDRPADVERDELDHATSIRRSAGRAGAWPLSTAKVTRSGR